MIVIMRVACFQSTLLMAGRAGHAVVRVAERGVTTPAVCPRRVEGIVGLCRRGRM